MQPSGSSVVSSSCRCTQREMEVCDVVHQGTGDADAARPLKGTRLFCTRWQRKSLNHAPLFLDMEEIGLEKSTTAKVREEGKRSNENNRLGRLEGSGLPAGWLSPRAPAGTCSPGREVANLTSSPFVGLKELTEVGLVQGGTEQLPPCHREQLLCYHAEASSCLSQVSHACSVFSTVTDSSLLPASCSHSVQPPTLLGMSVPDSSSFISTMEHPFPAASLSWL